MKRLLIFSLFLFSIPVLFLGLTNKGKSSSASFKSSVYISNAVTPFPKDFLNCIFNDGYDDVTDHVSYQLENNIDSIKELNFNAIHRYASKNDRYGQFNNSCHQNIYNFRYYM